MTWGVVMLSLIAVWVRSYWVADYVGWTTPAYQHYETYCNSGACVFMRNPFLGDPPRFYYGEGMPLRDADYHNLSPFHHAVGVHWMFGGAGPYLSVSFAWFVLFGVVLAMWPWVGPLPSVRRFSLRGLLIGTTFVASGLGGIAWLFD